MSDGALSRAAPAVSLFIALALGIYASATWSLESTHLVWFGAALGVAACIRWLGLWPSWLPMKLLGFACLGALLAVQQGALQERWLQALPEGTGVWTGYAIAEESVDGTLEWRLQLDPWPGRRRPQLHLVESAFDLPLPPEVWDELKSGRHIVVAGTLLHSRPSGNPGEFDFQQYLFRQGVVGTVFVQSIKTADDVPAPWLFRAQVVVSQGLSRARKWVSSAIERHASASAAPILLGILTGTRTTLDEEVEVAFRRTGISHLLAVSGLHVGMMAGLALLIARLFRLTGWRQFVLVVTCVWGFVFLAGGRPSALRAGLTATLGMLTYTMRRAVDPMQFWALAGLGLLAFRPLMLFDVGFQLSFAASGSILLWIRLVPGEFGMTKPWYYGMVVSCGIPLAAQLGTIVPVAFHFNEVSLSGIVVNWIAVPLAGPILFLGVAGTILGAIAPWLGWALLGSASVIVDTAIPGLLWIASQPWAAAEVAAPTVPTLIGWTLLLVGLPFACLADEARRKAWGWRLCLLGTILFAAAAWVPVVEAYRDVVHVTFIDVGQGDAILIRLPSGRAVLIDGGGRPRRSEGEALTVGYRHVIPLLQHLGVRQIDLLVNTHPDEDHLQGLVAVLAERRVLLVMDSGRTVDTTTFYEYTQAIGDQGIPHHAAKRGDLIELEPGIRLYVLNPPLTPTSDRSGNADSVVLRLETPHGSVLLTGDLDRAGQQELLWGGEKVDLSADVIKVPHHGSGRDVEWRFIDAVSPSIAVIQAGKNAYGHPAPATITAYEERGAKVYRTDAHGAVTVSFTPRGIRVRTHRAQ